MMDELEPVEFYQHSVSDLLVVVQGFDFGPDPWQSSVRADILANSALWLKTRTRCWLYRNQAVQWVGVGFLGKSKWSFPQLRPEKREVMVIPALGIDSDFSGKPKLDRSDDPQIDGRYSAQIMRHLIDTANLTEIAVPADPPLLGLFVDPLNKPSLGLYARFGFCNIGPPWPCPVTHVLYDKYAMELD